MQDYIFNSRRKAAARRRRFLLRLLVLTVIVVLAAIGAKLFLGSKQTDNPQPTPAQEPSDVLTLPPVENTKHTPQPGQTPAPEPDQTTETEITEELPGLAELPPTEQPGAATPEDKPPVQWLEHRVKQGENLATIFKQQKLTPGLLHKIVHSSDTAKNLANIKPGETIRFAIDNGGKLEQLVLQRNKISSLHIQSNGDDFLAEEINRETETRLATASGIIESSLFVDGQKQGLTDGQIMEMAGIFGWDIDFALEIREGDSFNLVYEEHYLDGEKFRNGPILAAEFTNRGTVYRALRYESKPGEYSYFDPEGRSKKRAFIRTPVKFARISSGFNPKRWHPVLKKWRSHKGVDYAARTGTPVKATGAGKVTFIGKKGGYGKVIFIRHGGKYTTVYGHLSKFSRKLKNGSKVKQGQIIGYVGSTGLATGPHLHYEFRVNGVHRNPLTVKLPKSDPLPKKQLKDFEQKTAELVAMLDQNHAKTMVASAAQIDE